MSSPNAGSFESLSIDLPQGGDATATLQVFGDEVSPQARIGLRALEGGAVESAAAWDFDPGTAQKSGSDAFMSRLRTVEMQGADGLLDVPAVIPATEQQPWAQAGYTLLPLEAPLGSYLPSAEDCEAELRLGPKTNVTFCREMLAASESVTLLLHPGPGLAVERVPADYDVTGQSVREVLNELLLTNGVRWWLEGDVLVVDARALPSGALALSGTDALGASVTWRDEPRTPAPEPQLSDFLERCAESIESDDGQGGTFETFDNGTFTTEGDVSDAGAEFSARTTITKENGKVVRLESVGQGLRTYPNNVTSIGPKYRKLNTYDYHDKVPEALLYSAEAVYAYADCADLYEADGIGAGIGAFKYATATVRPAGVPAYIYSVTYRIWESLLRQSPYLTKLVKTKQQWHAEGWLRHKTVVTRDFQGFLIDEDLTPGAEPDGDTPFEIKFLYRETVEDYSWTPVGGGLWLEEGTLTERVDRPIVKPLGAALTGDVFGVSTGVNITPFSRVTDAAPESVSLPEASCNAPGCAQQAQRDYEAAHASWAASEANSAGRRAYTVAYNRLRLDLARGSTLGSGIVLDVSHSLGRNQPGATTVQVVKGL